MPRVIRSLLVTASLFACSPSKKAAYERIANELNPIYWSLIPKVAVIQRLGPDAFDNDPSLASACAAADAELERLRVLSFEEPEIYPDGRGTRLSLQAASLIDHRHAMCVDPTGRSMVSGNCRRWCLDRWSFFTKIAAEFEAGASAEGVNVFRLPQVIPPGDKPPRYRP